MRAPTGLRNHIPLSGPATREPCDGTESPMRVSLGFTPKWYADRLGVDFSECWHLDPGYRYGQMLRMKEYLADVFPEVDYFRPKTRASPVSGREYEASCATISTVFGIMPVSSAYGLGIAYRPDNWPDALAGAHLSRRRRSRPSSGEGTSIFPGRGPFRAEAPRFPPSSLRWTRSGASGVRSTAT